MDIINISMTALATSTSSEEALCTLGVGCWPAVTIFMLHSSVQHQKLFLDIFLSTSTLIATDLFHKSRGQGWQLYMLRQSIPNLESYRFSLVRLTDCIINVSCPLFYRIIGYNLQIKLNTQYVS